MKITVRHKETEIVIDESGNPNDTKRYATMRFSDEKENIIAVLNEAVQRVQELNETIPDKP